MGVAEGDGDIPGDGDADADEDNAEEEILSLFINFCFRFFFCSLLEFEARGGTTGDGVFDGADIVVSLVFPSSSLMVSLGKGSSSLSSLSLFLLLLLLLLLMITLGTKTIGGDEGRE